MTIGGYTRDISNYKNKIKFNSLDDISGFSFNELKQNTDYLFSLEFEGEVYLDFLLNIGSIPSLLTMFNSAVPESYKNLNFPIFTGRKLVEKLQSSKLFFSDPLLQLSKENNVFWYLGSNKLPTQEIIANILKVIKDKLSIQKMLFWGSSGGGFPALYFSNIFIDSVALVNAPTTTIDGHHRDGALQGARNTLKDDYNASLVAVTDLIGDSSKNQAIILQNINDKIFLKYHLKPYLLSKNISLIDDGITEGAVKVVIRDWGKGHVVAPRYILNNILRLFEKEGAEFEASFNTKRLLSIVDIDIVVSSRNNALEIKVNNVPDPAMYAIYLCQDYKVELKLPYQKDNNFIIREKLRRGTYYAKVYVKFAKDGFILVNESIRFQI